jgi:hypothetical protein
MFNKVSLNEIAEKFSWNSWEDIKAYASGEAGFIRASLSEKEIMSANFKAPINMSVENINQHARTSLDGLYFSGNFSVQAGKKHKFKVINQEGSLLSHSESSRVNVEFICPNCECVYSFYLAVKHLTKDSPFCRKCCKSILHKCNSYKSTYADSMTRLYGVKYPLQHKELQRKMRDTMIKNYGVMFSTESVSIENKRKITMIQKYGRDNIWRGINPHEEYSIVPSGVQISRGEKHMVDTLDNTLFKNCKTRSYKNSQQKFQTNGIIGFFDYFVPDLNLAVEFYGDYFHANPKIYESNYIIRPGVTAADVWYKNNTRNDAARFTGVNVFVVWERDWETDQNNSIKDLQEFVNDYCKNS